MAKAQAQAPLQQNTTQKWKYKGVSLDGSKQMKGTIEANSRDQAVARITQMGAIPTELVNLSAGTGLNKNIEIKGLAKLPSKKDFAVTSRQLATMVSAGVSLIRALNIVIEQTRNPPVMVYMVRAGETGGFLDKSLITVADSFEADVRLQGQIKSALAYPVVVLCIALALVAVMLLTIVPMFDSMYKSMNATLPLITQIMVAMGKVAPVAIPLVIVGLIAFFIFWRRNRNKDFIRSWWEPFLLKAPVFGKLNTNVALARFCNNFSSMLASGVPILNALDIVGSTSGNYVLDTASKRVSNLVERGYRLSDSMASENVFPTMLTQMVSIGEDSGAIDQMLASAGKAYDEEAQSMAKQLTSLLEPLMILVLGVVVGFMVLGLYMPMFSMFDAMNATA